MTEANVNRASPAEERAVSELDKMLRDVSIGDEFHVAPSADICFALEQVLPQLLRERYLEWAGETLDGVFVSRAVKAAANRARLVGVCVLMGDQTVAPFLVDEISPLRQSLASWDIAVGEQAGGTLGISGPPCNSGAATRLRKHLPDRVDANQVDWVYQVSGKSTY